MRNTYRPHIFPVTLSVVPSGTPPIFYVKVCTFLFISHLSYRCNFYSPNDSSQSVCDTSIYSKLRMSQGVSMHVVGAGATDAPLDRLTRRSALRYWKPWRIARFKFSGCQQPATTHYNVKCTNIRSVTYQNIARLSTPTFSMPTEASRGVYN